MRDVNECIEGVVVVTGQVVVVGCGGGGAEVEIGCPPLPRWYEIVASYIQ